MNPLPRWWLTVALLTALLSAGCGAPQPEITVAAASSMQPVVDAVAAKFGEGFVDGQGRRTRCIVHTTYGASQQLMMQIFARAPVDVFIAADTHSVDLLKASGNAQPNSDTVYAYGRIVLWLRNASAQTGLAALDDARVRKIGIANPDFAPYGAAARGVLRQTNRWDMLQPRLVFGESVGQVATYARRGEVDAAFLPQALAREHNLAAQAIPEAPRLAQALCITGTTQRFHEAWDFVNYLTGPEGRALLQAKGYDLP